MPNSVFFNFQSNDSLYKICLLLQQCPQKWIGEVDFNITIRIMSFLHIPELIDNALSYASYRADINNILSRPPADETAEKIRPYI